MTSAELSAPRWLTRPPEIVGVYIGRYKNLSDLWVPWSARAVIIGPNAVGKSNVFDCMALLMGTPETKRLVERRIRPDLDFDISLVISGDHLVVPPEDLNKVGLLDLLEVAAGPLLADVEWLRAIDAKPGQRLQDILTQGATAIGASPVTVAQIAGALAHGTARFRLRSANGARSWTRTVVTEKKIKLTKTEANVPWPYAPLLSRWSSEPHGQRDPFWDLIELPRGRQVPIDLQWLPANRAEPEMARDLNQALYDCLKALGLDEADRNGTGFGEGFAQTLAGFIVETTNGLVEESEGLDFIGWLIAEAERACRRELATTMPRLAGSSLVRSTQMMWEAPDDEECLVEVHIESAQFAGVIDLASIVQFHSEPFSASSVLAELSAAERRWFDESIHTATVAMRDTARRAQGWLGPAIAELQLVDDTDGLPTIGVRATLEAAWDRRGAWDPAAVKEALDVVIALLPALNPKASEAIRRLGSSDDTTDRFFGWLQIAMYGIEGPHARVRLFDEPEAHLHTGALGRIADALHRLADGADIVVATHHPLFVYQPGWRTLHLTSVEGRSVLRSYRSTIAEKRYEVATSLGLTPGEALAGARATLLVEGEHDKCILAAEPFGSVLSEAGVFVQPVRGVNQFSDHETGDVSALALESVVLLARGTVGIMFDNDAAHGRQTYEQQTVDRFVREAAARGLRVVPVGLDRPDVVAYLNPGAIGPGFSWEPVLEAFQASGRSGFKDWLWEKYRVNLSTVDVISPVLARMAEQGLPFQQELVRKINEFVAQIGRE